jgi:hypothetical protein
MDRGMCMYSPVNKKKSPNVVCTSTHFLSYPHADTHRGCAPPQARSCGARGGRPAGVEQTPAVLAAAALEGRRAAELPRKPEGARLCNLPYPSPAPTLPPAIPTPLAGFCIAAAHPIHGRLVRPAGHPRQ